MIYEWAAGGDWDRIIRKAGIADGDMAMLIMRTADNLRQIMSLRETHPEMAALATEARGRFSASPLFLNDLGRIFLFRNPRAAIPKGCIDFSDFPNLSLDMAADNVI